MRDLPHLNSFNEWLFPKNRTNENIMIDFVLIGDTCFGKLQANHTSM
jgi:hypothetical protein